MASGTISGSTNYTGLAARMLWSQAADAANNQSRITLTMQVKNTTGSYFSYGANWTVTVDGTGDSFQAAINASAQGSPWTNVWEKTYTVNHASDGTKTARVSVSGSYKVGTYNGTATIPGTNLVLDAIDPVRPASIVSVTQAVGTDGNGEMTIRISKPERTVYCQAVVTLGSYQGSVSLDSGTQATYTLPASWAGAIGQGGKRGGTVTVITYREAGHTTEAGRVSAAFTAYRKCLIASNTPVVTLDGAGKIEIEINKTNAVDWAQATVALGGHSVSINLDGVTRGSASIPASWVDAIGSGGTAQGRVGLESFTGSDHETRIGQDTATFTAYKPVGIASASEEVLITGTGLMAVNLAKSGTVGYCQVEIALGTKVYSVSGDSVNEVRYTIPAAWASELPESSQAQGTVTVTTYTAADHQTAAGKATATFTAMAHATIAQVPAGAALGETVRIRINKPMSGMYVLAAVTLGTHHATIDFNSVTESTFTVPASWGDQFPSSRSATLEVAVMTYMDAAHTAAVTEAAMGYLTVTAPASTKPTGAQRVLWVEKGTYSGTDGSDLAYGTRLRSGYIRLGAGTYTTDNEQGMDTAVGVYDLDRQLVSDSDWQSAPYTFTLDGERLVRLTWRQDNSTALEPSDLSGVTLTGLVGGNTVEIYAHAMAYAVSGNSTVNGWGVAVAGCSRIHVRVDGSKVHPSTAGETIAGYQASAAGESGLMSVRGGKYHWESTNAVRTGGNVSVAIIGSRGYTDTAQEEMHVYDYHKPMLAGMDLYRSDAQGVAAEDGEYIRAISGVSWSNCGGNNPCALKARYKESIATSWGAWQTMTAGTALLMGGGELNARTAYLAQIQAEDGLGNTGEYEEPIPTDRISVHIKRNNLGLGIGRYAGQDYWIMSQFGLDTAGDVKIAGDLDTAGDVKIGGNLEFYNAANIPYFNLGPEGTEIVNDSDLNDYTELGNYYCSTDSGARTLLHKPSSLILSFVMRVYCSCGPQWARYRIQEITQWANGTMWRRQVTPDGQGGFAFGTWYKFDMTAD